MLPRSEPVRIVSAGRPQITLIVVLIMVLLHVCVWLGVLPGENGERMTLLRMGAKSTALIADAGESWRLLSAHFIHTGWLHIIFNLAFFFPVSAALESILKKQDFVCLLMFTALGAGLASVTWTPEVSAGASGLVFGMLGAAIVVGLRHSDSLRGRARSYFGLWVLPFLLAILISGAGNAQIDHSSHIGGLLSGILLAPFLRLRGGPRDRYGDFARIAPIAGSVICALVLAPEIAGGGGRPGVRYHLETMEMTLPSAWHAEYGLLGEMRFRGATQLAAVSIDPLPSATMDSSRAKNRQLASASLAQRWYEGRRLNPLERTGMMTERSPAGPCPDRVLPGAGARLESCSLYRFNLEGQPTVREVYLLDTTRRWVLVSFETPAPWFDKYLQTRRDVLGSIRYSPLRPQHSARSTGPQQAATTAVP